MRGRERRKRVREAGRERERKGDIEKVRGRERQGKRVGEK